MATGLFLCGNIEPGFAMQPKCVVETLISTIDNLIIFDWYKSAKLEKLIENSHEAKIMKVGMEGCNDWRGVRTAHEKAIKESGIDTLIVFKVLLNPGFMHRDMSAIYGFAKALNAGNFNHSWTYETTKTMLGKYAFVATAARLCENIYHFVLDPQEADFASVLKMRNFQKLYGMNRHNDYKYMPCFEYGTNRLAIETGRDNKSTDFIFYCSAMSQDRKWIADQKDNLESIPGWDVQINVAKSMSGEAPKPLPQEQYYHKLSESRYTVCIKAYEADAFSMYRFVEALCRDCLSFVFDDCCLDDVEATFPEIFKIMQKWLIVDSFEQIRKNIAEWPEFRRQRIIQRIKQTEEWQNITSLDYVKSEWQKLQGVDTR